MREMWMERGYYGEVFGITPSLSESMARGKEIAKYMKDRNLKIESYVIFDDDDDMLPSQERNFVKTQGEIGITLWNADHAIEILSRKSK